MEHSSDSTLWIGFASVVGVWLVTVVTPGPNFLAAAHAALAQSRRAGLLVSLGIMIGTFLWAAVSLAGLGLLFQNGQWLYHAIRVAGAIYLVVVGIRMLAARSAPSSPGQDPTGPGLGFRALRRGLLTDLSNPKAAAFFTSLFAVAVPPSAPFWYDALIVSTVVIMAGGWYAIVAVLVTTPRMARAYARAERAILRVAGAVFVGFGIKLAAER